MSIIMGGANLRTFFFFNQVSLSVNSRSWKKEFETVMKSPRMRVKEKANKQVV